MPRLVSERQPGGHWDRCLESSFSMLTDKMSIGAFVVDARKLEAVIPNASLHSNVQQNLDAIAKVYPTFPVDNIHKLNSTDVIQGLLTTGRGLAANGYYDVLAKQPGNFTRWDPAFAKRKQAGHAAYVQIDGPNGVRRWDARAKFVWWMDPLATPDFPGEWMPLATFLAFLDGATNAYGAEASVVTAGPSQGVDDVIYTLGGTKSAIFPAGTSYSHEPGGPAVGKIPAAARFLIRAYDVTGKYVAIDGLYAAPIGTKLVPMGWVLAGSATAVQDALTSTDCSAAVAAATAPLNAKIHAAQEALA